MGVKRSQSIDGNTNQVAGEMKQLKGSRAVVAYGQCRLIP